MSRKSSSDDNSILGLPPIFYKWHLVQESSSVDVNSRELGDKRFINLEYWKCKAETDVRLRFTLVYLITKSAQYPELVIAAANAITILNYVRLKLTSELLKNFPIKHWRGIRIPGADLSYAMLDGLDLSDSDLRDVNVTGASMRGVVLTGANVKGLKFGQMKPFSQWIKVRQGGLQSGQRYHLEWAKGAGAASFSPDGAFLAIACGKIVKVFRVADQQCVQIFGLHDTKVNSVAFSSDGEYVLSSSGSRSKFGSVSLLVEWSCKTGRRRRIYSEGQYYFSSAAFSYDNAYVLEGRDRSILEYNHIDDSRFDPLEHRPPVKTYELDSSNDLVSCIYSPDDRHILSRGLDEFAVEWSRETGKQERVYNFYRGCISSMAYSPDSKSILLGYENGDLLESSRDGEITYEYDLHTSSVCSVAYSPDGKRILSADVYGNVVESSRSSGDVIRRHVSKRGRQRCIYAPDGHSVLIMSGRMKFLWSGTSLRFRFQFSRPNLDWQDHQLRAGVVYQGARNLSAENYQLLRFYRQVADPMFSALFYGKRYEENFAVVFALVYFEGLPSEIVAMSLAKIFGKYSQTQYLELIKNPYTPLKEFLPPICEAVKKAGDPDADIRALAKSEAVQSMIGRRVAIPFTNNLHSRLDADGFRVMVKKLVPDFFAHDAESQWALFKMFIRLAWFEHYAALSDEALGEVIEPTCDSPLTLAHQKCYASLALSFHYRKEPEKARRYHTQAEQYDKEIASTVDGYVPELLPQLPTGTMT